MTKKSAFLVFSLFTSVRQYVNIIACLPDGKHKTPEGEGFSGEPHDKPGRARIVSVDTRT
jgi:hypothetical protein